MNDVNNLNYQSEIIFQAFNDKYLNLIIFPTEKCNFRCTYCYEDFKIGVMKAPIIDSIKNLLSNRIQDLDRLEISWFGGEPLLAKQVIYEISQEIVTTARSNNPKLNYDSNITTNGFYLDLETFEALVGYGIRVFQITLDGDKHEHDLTRVTTLGKGTFNRIWENLVNIRESKAEAEIVLRLHYTLDNIDSLILLTERLNDEFSDDIRFKFNFKSVDHLGSINDNTIRIVPKEQKMELKNLLESRVKNKNNLYSLSIDSPYICFASKPNSFAIRADGRISKCTVALNKDFNILGNINPDGTLTIINGKLDPWIVGFQNFDLSALECPRKRIEQLTDNALAEQNGSL